MSTNIKRVLIIDNDETESQMLAALLRKAGHEATTTWSGLEALEMVRTKTFDLILTNDYLPDIYIGEFFQRVNNLPDPPCCIVMEESSAWEEMTQKIKSTLGSAKEFEN